MLLASVATLLATAVITAQAAAVAPLASDSRMKRDPATGFEWDPENFKVAAVRKPRVGFVYHALSDQLTWWNYDLNATIAQSVEMIHQAAAEGTKFIAFPELYFPGSTPRTRSSYPAFRTANGPEDLFPVSVRSVISSRPLGNPVIQPADATFDISEK
ncbi:hypothetical protein BP00DRAFT_410846 [Aspergillus indologenus CBS 114.80]|uniref:CN hydrolase domain-containing protein n=1 Tax=Aspergillus indologenus CBS 114.80 TaxID=1450541 RepID=A0A2V5IJ47_9EURO|nr:hypothetical protein BP00DRAFT_410846 [Aspergillus indologenus CBS 114.80]